MRFFALFLAWSILIAARGGEPEVCGAADGPECGDEGSLAQLRRVTARRHGAEARREPEEDYSRPPSAPKLPLLPLLHDVPSFDEDGSALAPVHSILKCVSPPCNTTKCAKPPCSSQVHVHLGGPGEMVVVYAANGTTRTPSKVTYWKRGKGEARHESEGEAQTYSALSYYVSDWLWGGAPIPGPFDANPEAIAESMSTYDWAYYGNDTSRHVPGLWKNVTVEDVNNINYPGEFGDYKNPKQWYTSPEIHTVVLRGLTADTVYEYQVPNNDKVFHFKMPKGEGEATTEKVYPFKVGLLSDVGQTSVSVVSMKQVLNFKPEVALLSGDLCYADGYYHRWDTFGNLFQPLGSSIPVMMCPGNHEFSYGESFQTYNARYPMPSRVSGSKNPTYWSRDIGPMHVVSLNSYADSHPGSEQYAWLARDLEEVFCRDTTPWLVVMMHVPFYNSNDGHLMEGKVMRDTLEPLFFKHGVDMVFSGHVHAYERTTNVYQNVTNECGPMYFNVGDAGNKEGPAHEWLPGNDGRYRPQWTAFRQNAFGTARLIFHSATTAEYSFRRNSCYDNEGKPDFDSIDCETADDNSQNADTPGETYWVKRNAEGCPNKA